MLPVVAPATMTIKIKDQVGSTITWEYKDSQNRLDCVNLVISGLFENLDLNSKFRFEFKINVKRLLTEIFTVYDGFEFQKEMKTIFMAHNLFFLFGRVLLEK